MQPVLMRNYVYTILLCTSPLLIACQLERPTQDITYEDVRIHAPIIKTAQRTMVGNRPVYTHMLGSKYNQIVVELNTYFCLGQQATVTKKQNSTSDIISYDYHLNACDPDSGLELATNEITWDEKTKSYWHYYTFIALKRTRKPVILNLNPPASKPLLQPEKISVMVTPSRGS